MSLGYIEGCDCVSCREARDFEEMRRKQAKINQEHKMINSELTKEEAIKLMNEALWGYSGAEVAAKWVDVWEKLGIVKFKDDPVIEIVSSPRPVDRDHLKRDFESTLEDLEANLKTLRYMYEEL